MSLGRCVVPPGTPLELATEKLECRIHLSFTETVQDQRTIEGNCPQQIHIVIVVKNTLASSFEGVIRASIFGMGNDDVLSEQVERLIDHLAHLLFITLRDQIRGVNHHLQVRGRHPAAAVQHFQGPVITPLGHQAVGQLFLLVPGAFRQANRADVAQDPAQQQRPVFAVARQGRDTPGMDMIGAPRRSTLS